MFRVSYKDMWEALARVKRFRGTDTHDSMLRQLLRLCAFDNNGVLIPDEYKVKK